MKVTKGTTVSHQRSSVPARSALRVACVARPQNSPSCLSLVKVGSPVSKQLDWAKPTAALLAPFVFQVSESMAKGGELGILGESVD